MLLSVISVVCPWKICFSRLVRTFRSFRGGMFHLASLVTITRRRRQISRSGDVNFLRIGIYGLLIRRTKRCCFYLLSPRVTYIIAHSRTATRLHIILITPRLFCCSSNPRTAYSLYHFYIIFQRVLSMTLVRDWEIQNYRVARSRLSFRHRTTPRLSFLHRKETYQCHVIVKHKYCNDVCVYRDSCRAERGIVLPDGFRKVCRAFIDNPEIIRIQHTYA